MPKNPVLDDLLPDIRLKWQALSVLASQLPLMDPAVSVELTQPETGCDIAAVTVTILSDHTLSKGTLVALGMLSNHADLMHPYICGEQNICMEYTLDLLWKGGKPS